MLGSAAAVAPSGLQLSFPCTLNSDTRGALSGPALNLWAALAPAVAPANSTVAAAGARGGGSCRLTTLSPAVYYKQRVPAALFYGYQLQGLACAPLDAAAAAKALTAGDGLAAGAPEGRVAVHYGLYVVPALPSVSGGVRLIGVKELMVGGQLQP